MTDIIIHGFAVVGFVAAVAAFGYGLLAIVAISSLR